MICAARAPSLARQLREWRADGDKLIVCMDANENVYSKSIGKLLTDTSDLAMVKVVSDFTRQPLPATYFRGSKPINAMGHARR